MAYFIYFSSLILQLFLSVLFWCENLQYPCGWSNHLFWYGAHQALRVLLQRSRVRKYLEYILSGFLNTLATKYKTLSDERCPTLSSRLPLARQGVCTSLTYGTKLFFILSRDYRYSPYSFIFQDGSVVGTWDESEYAELSEGNCIDDSSVWSGWRKNMTSLTPSNFAAASCSCSRTLASSSGFTLGSLVPLSPLVHTT